MVVPYKDKEFYKITRGGRDIPDIPLNNTLYESDKFRFIEYVGKKPSHIKLSKYLTSTELHVLGKFRHKLVRYIKLIEEILDSRGRLKSRYVITKEKVPPRKVK